MSAAALLDRLYRRGVRFRVDGDRLRWLAPIGVVSDADLVTLRQHKGEALAILQQELHDRIEERAAILEFDAGISRFDADQQARAEAAG